jgi:Arc/MetJ-type ribon-helix-helix transcriptional regulator
MKFRENAETFQFRLEPEQAKKVNQLVNSGMFRNKTEVIRYAIYKNLFKL